MKDLLQAKSKVAGVQVLRMELMEIAFHEQVARGLLQVQQAQAKVQARKKIVEGSVLIVRDALIRLDEENVQLTHEAKQKLTKNLVLITCSENGPPRPVISL